MVKCDLSKIWPEWSIEEKIGEGSYGVVYKAVRTDHNVESNAAIKVITVPNSAGELDSLQTEMGLEGTRHFYQSIVNDFVHEIQLMQSMKGTENVVSIEDYKVVEKTGEIGWDIYIRMELLTPFTSVLKSGKLTEDEVIKLGCDICAALELCGKRDIMHRDIKPENIFVNDFGSYKLGDFGIARKMESSTAGMSQKGTPYYMAPEVITTTNYDNRVDTYSLGIVLYRLMNNNRIPFLDPNATSFTMEERTNAVGRRINGEELPAPVEASDELANVILRACAFNPDDRFESATAMREALMAVKNKMYVIVPLPTKLDETVRVNKPGQSGDVNDKTGRVRKPGEGVDKNDQTGRVRKPDKKAAKQKAAEAKAAAKAEKKKKKKGGFLLFLLLLLGIAAAGIFVVPGLLNDGDGGDYTYQDRTEIQDIIDSAQKRADKGNYEEALLKIEEGLKNYPASNSLKEKADEYRKNITQQKLAEAEKYANAGNYLSAMTVIESAQKTFGNNHDYEEAYETYQKAHLAQVKKKTLDEAAAYAAAGNYASAVTVIKSAMQTYGEDPDYVAAYNTYNNELQTQVKKDTLAKASQYATQGDYKAAMDTIRNAQTEYGDNAEYQQAYAEYEAQYVAQVKARALSEALKMAEEKDYIGAIARLNTAIDELGEGRDVSDLTAKVTEYKNAYIAQVVADADALVAARDYDGAIAAIDAGLQNYPDDAVLTAKRAAIEKSKPKLFMDTVTPYEKSDYSTPSSIVMAGVTYYSKTFVMRCNYDNNTYALYNLNGQYQTLEFDLGHIDGSPMYDVNVTIYLDGEVNTVINAKAQDLPKHHIINLNGAKQMKISVTRATGGRYDYPQYAFVNAFIYEK